VEVAGAPGLVEEAALEPALRLERRHLQSRKPTGCKSAKR
jgi:hypothetical protein